MKHCLPCLIYCLKGTTALGCDVTNNSFYVYVVSGMVIVDGAGNMAAGTTTNGANHKIPG